MSTIQKLIQLKDNIHCGNWTSVSADWKAIFGAEMFQSYLLKHEAFLREEKQVIRLIDRWNDSINKSVQIHVATTFLKKFIDRIGADAA